MRARFLPLALCAALLVLGLPGLVESDDAVRALVTRVSGDPTILQRGSPEEEGPLPHTPRVLDLVPGGSNLRLDEGERIELLCSTEHLVLLDRPGDTHLTADLCRQGRRQPAGSFRSALPKRGRLIEVGDVLALQMTTRSDETRAVPVLLAPRNTALLDRTPELLWAATPGAIEYEIHVVGPPPIGSHQVVLEPREANCGALREEWPGAEVCTLAWSEIVGSTEIPPTGVYLDVGSRFALGAPVRKQDRSPRAWSLPEAEGEEVRDRLCALPDPQDEPFLHAVLAVRPLVESGLYHEARERLLAALEIREAPSLLVTLGDLHMEIALPEWAAESYRRAAEGAEDPVVLGAALYGLGRAEIAMNRFDAAREHFERAVGHFEEAGLAHERSASVEAAAEARGRSKTD